MRKILAVLAVAAVSFTAWAPAAGASERTTCIIVQHQTVICVDIVG